MATLSNEDDENWRMMIPVVFVVELLNQNNSTKRDTCELVNTDYQDACLCIFLNASLLEEVSHRTSSNVRNGTLDSHSEVAKFPKCETKKESALTMRAIPKIESFFFYSDKLQFLLQEGRPLYTLVQFFLSWSDSIIYPISVTTIFWTKHLLRSTIICQVRYGNCESSRLKAIHAAARETAFPASFVQVVKDAHKKWDAEFGAQQIEEIRKRIEACRGFSANLGSWCIDMYRL